AAAHMRHTGAERDQQRLLWPLDLDVAAGLDGPLGDGLTTGALVEARDRIDPLGKPYGCGRTDRCMRGHTGRKPHGTQVPLKSNEETPKCAATPGTRETKRTEAASRSCERSAPCRLERGRGLARRRATGLGHAAGAPPAPAADGHDGDHVEQRYVPM